ncbi:TAXI family TRAP transporter solute-binding subunit [Alkalihalobacillus sp. BA299]|uniref:TAXI family TRAP transporter solute-binding subunit n=1 Tax=Alkalihalobacillus sp. BA299 TaxID=2815938 RepID=UPI001ADA6898|nr:TAXI family TRAP transporter solute-binding subunit [Alkalihalobacillus sp. BA299]
MEKKKLLLLFVSIVSAMFIVVGCGANEAPEEGAAEGGDAPEVAEDFKTDLQLGTGSTGGTYYPLGTEIATVLNANVEHEGFNVSAIETGASVDNLARIARGEIQLGMTVHLPALDALKGEGEFDGMSVENFGFMGHIYPEVMQIITVDGTGIESIADLEGKRVAIGPPGSGTQAAAKAILAAYGIEDGDYESFEEGFGDAKDRLQNGQIDASFGLLGLPAGSVTELALQRNVKLLSIDDEQLAQIEEASGYMGYEIPADAYEFLSEPVQTVTAYAVLVGSTSQISEELGYEITKALFENSGNITHDQGRHLTKENALSGAEGLPLHPGADRYFEEAGLK